MTSMGSLAAELSVLMPMPVEDRTGLTGKYDFVVPRRSDLLSTDDLSRSTSWGIEELGLELKPSKIPMEPLVIEHIERPSPN